MAVTVNVIIAGGASGAGSGGGATAFLQLTDATSVDLPSVNAPLAAALAIAGGGGLINIPYTPTIPLNSAQGQRMAGADGLTPVTLITVNTVLVEGVGSIPDGLCSLIIQTNGVNTFSVPSTWTRKGAAISVAAGIKTEIDIIKLADGSVLYATTQLGANPTLVSASVSDANPLEIDLVWSTPISPTISAAAAFAITGTHALTSHVYDGGSNSHLITSTPFLQAELQSISYSQPVSNKMQDLGGVLVNNFSGLPITVNVIQPTIVSATVQNATPLIIGLVWSKPMNSTVSAAAAFTIAGHALTAHTFDTSTTSHLTTSAAFVAGETVTLAYTIPGSNPMKDTAGGNNVLSFAGFPVTDLVGGVAFTDSFNRADSGTLGTASGGFVWVQPAAGTGIVSNKAKGIGDNTVNVGGSNFVHSVQADINFGDVNQYTGLRLLGDGTNNNFWGVGCKSTGALEVFNRLGGVFNGGNFTAAGTVANGVTATCRLRSILDSGNPGNYQVILSVNGTDLFTVSNIPPTALGHVCGFFPNSANDTFDVFSAS